MGRALAYGKVLAAAGLWSTIGVVSVYGGDPLLQALFRSLFAAACGLALYRPRSTAALWSGLLLGGLFTVYPLAAVFAGVGTAAYLLYTAPLWTAAASAALGERPSRVELAAVGMVVAAVLLMASASAAGELNAVGLAAGLTSSLLYGLYMVVARHYSRRGLDAEVSLGAMPYTLAITGPAAAIRAAVFGTAPDQAPVAAGLYLALFATLLPYRLFSSAVKAIEATRASVVATLEPVLAALWGLLLGQTPTALMTSAYILITAAALTAARTR